MSFAIWRQKPPFPEKDLTHTDTCDEHIYARVHGTWKLQSDLAKDEVPDLWCISSEGLPVPEKVAALGI